MKKNPLISIIVPVYKVELYLENCINSIINQSYKNLEIILVDDGSPDKCPEICDELAKKDKRIKVIHKNNAGVSAARNSGLDIATGDFITFVDSDDTIEPVMYEKLVLKQQENDYDLTFARYCFEENNKKTKVLEESLQSLCDNYDLKLFFNHTSPTTKDDFIIIDKNIMCNIWRVLFKKEVIANIRFPENIKYMEDFVFMINIFLSKKLKLAFINEYLYNYLVRNSSASRDKSTGMIENSQSFISAITPILKNTEYQSLIGSLEFFCFSECAISKYVFGAKIDLSLIKHWNSKLNYKIKKTTSFGLKQKLKYFLVHHKLYPILSLLYKIK